MNWFTSVLQHWAISIFLLSFWHIFDIKWDFKICYFQSRAVIFIIVGQTIPYLGIGIPFMLAIEFFWHNHDSFCIFLDFLYDKMF